mmetsp:Transcript_7165/g.21858  ORF Transcript_7165/g.21858 Transcript_7165/m.21858 type:complete len:97 (+) Transcript_7165:71-361(+)
MTEGTKMPGSKNELKERNTTVPHHKAIHQPPVTASSDGSAKRNITRRHGGGHAERKVGVSKFAADDGTLEEAVSVLDDKDPNFVSSDDPVLVSNYD